MWSRWVRRILVFGVWIFVGLYFSVQVYLQQVYEKQSITLAQALFNGLVFWILWAIFSPVIIWLARNFRITREQWFDSLLFHIPTGVIFSIVHLIIDVVITSLIQHDTPLTFASMVERSRQVFSTSFAWWSTVYWAILISIHAFDYYQDYQKGQLRSSQLEAKLAQSQLQALKMQLQPHFLFNTLNSISALLTEDIDAADKMIARLGDFLRLTLDDSGSQEVTLQKELEFLDCYLEIEKFRFQDRLNTEITVQPGVLNALIPHLVLQPIVENAIKHGIAQSDRPGQIQIAVIQRRNYLQIEVRDSGPGLPTNGSNKIARTEGIGLANTRARLQQLYGDAQKLDMYNAPEGGLIVTLEIPFQTAGKAELAMSGAIK
ncbi:MAG TPA: histidine kinase [Blastocatellia bacterium]|nr:histidine kinase [Blastocatellia bacterium]